MCSILFLYSFKDPNIEDSPLEKRVWLPELDEGDKEEEEETKGNDDVYQFNLRKEMNLLRYYFIMGYMYPPPIFQNVLKTCVCVKTSFSMKF